MDKLIKLTFITSVLISFNMAKAEKLKRGNQLPIQSVTDVFGKQVNLSDGKVFLTFYRNVDCAMCNLRIHNLLADSQAFKSAGIKVIIALQSDAAVIIEHLNGESFPYTLVADPDQELFNKLGGERSKMKSIKAFRRIRSVVQIKKRKIPLIKEQRGDMEMAPIELLLNKGEVLKSHYAGDIGDHLKIKHVISRFAKKG